MKVRDGLMDIKVLREVNAEGLERWEPVMKQPFPLPGDCGWSAPAVYEIEIRSQPRGPQSARLAMRRC